MRLLIRHATLSAHHDAFIAAAQFTSQAGRAVFSSEQENLPGSKLAAAGDHLIARTHALVDF